MAGGAAIAQLAFIAATPILTRLYPPLSYGYFASLMAVSAIYAPIAALRYDFLYFKHKENRDHFFSACIITILLTLPLCYVSFSFFYSDANSLQGNLLLLLVICSSGLLNLTSQFLIGSLEYASFSRTKAVQGLIQVVLALLLGFAGNTGGLVWALLWSQIITAGLQYRALVRDRNISLTMQGGLLTLAHGYKLALTSTFTTLLQYSTPLAPVFISMHFFTKEQSGIYFFCAQLFSLPLSLFRRALLNIITSEFTDIQKAKEAFTRIYCKTRRYYFSVVVAVGVILVAIMMYGPHVFTLLFGDEWGVAGDIAWIVLLMFIVDMFCQPISNMLTLWNAEIKNLLVELIRFNSVFTLPVLLLKTYGLSFNQYVLVHCSAMICVYILSSFITLRKMVLHAT